MYGVKFQPKCLRAIIFFVQRYFKNLRYSEIIHGGGQAFTETQGTFKQKDMYSSEKTSSFSGLSKKLYLSLADFTKTLAIKVKL